MYLVRKIPYILPNPIKLSTINIEVDTSTTEIENYLECGGLIQLNGLEKYVFVEREGAYIKEYIFVSDSYGMLGTIHLYGIGLTIYERTHGSNPAKYPIIFRPATAAYMKNNPLCQKEFLNGWDIEFVSKYYIDRGFRMYDLPVSTQHDILTLQALFNRLNLYNAEAIPNMWFNFSKCISNLNSVSFDYEPPHNYPSLIDSIVAEFGINTPINIIRDPLSVLMLAHPYMPPTVYMQYLRYHVYDIDDSSINIETDILKLLESSDVVIYAGQEHGGEPLLSVAIYAIYELLANSPFYECKLEFYVGNRHKCDMVVNESTIYNPFVGASTCDSLLGTNWYNQLVGELECLSESMNGDGVRITLIVQDYHAFIILRIFEKVITVVYDMIAMRLISRTLLLTAGDPLSDVPD